MIWLYSFTRRNKQLILGGGCLGPIFYIRVIEILVHDSGSLLFICSTELITKDRMNTMKNEMVSEVYISPESYCREILVEGILCQSMPDVAITEEWDVVDLSEM